MEHLWPKMIPFWFNKHPDRTSPHLQERLELALENETIHEGNFAFGTTMHSAPNPGLEIRTLGMIGLPLGTHDVDSIKSIAAARAPHGHCEKSTFDSTIGVFWEVDASQITLKNPNWAPFLKDIVDAVWKGLSVSPYDEPPTCELCKLLLYETGSHFLTHQDTEEVPGMFATIIIVLPSMYTGGEVRAVHGKEEIIFDYASTSQLSTSVLAWYADVVHEVKPITSGFRLALSYNLIQRSHLFDRTSIRLSPQVLSISSGLKDILSRWSGGALAEPPNIVCYKLQHRYSPADLARGFACLTGNDAHKVARLKKAAEELKIGFALGQLVMHIVEEDDDYGFAYSKRRRLDIDSELVRSFTVSDIVDLDGKPIYPALRDIRVDGTGMVIIPKDAFRSEKPDEAEHNGHTDGATIDKWYRRTALVLYLKEERSKLLFYSGLSAVINHLQMTDAVSEPPQDVKDCLGHLLMRGTRFCYSYSRSSEVMDIAVKWNNLQLWEKAATGCGFYEDLIRFDWKKVVAAWEKFGFEALRPSLEEAIRNYALIKDRLQLLDAIKAQNAVNAQASTSEWCKRQTDLMVSGVPHPVPDDVQSYFSIIKSDGLPFFKKRIMPQLLRHECTYDFFLEFAKTLDAADDNLTVNADDMQLLIRESLNAAMKQWEPTFEDVYAWVHPAAHTRTAFGRIKKLVEHLISTNRLKALQGLLERLVEDSESVESRINLCLDPIAPDLVRTLEEHTIPIDSDICKGFFHWLIENYLQFVLGTRTSGVKYASIRELGCDDSSCDDCRELDHFIKSTKETQEFRVTEKRRKHLEHQVSEATDMVTHCTHRKGRPYKLEVKKRTEIIGAVKWHKSQQAAEKFMLSIGGVDTIRRVMGKREADVKRALSGKKAYVVGIHVLGESAASAPDTGTASAVKGSRNGAGEFSDLMKDGTAGKCIPSTDSVVGVKRKERPIDIDTAEDSA